MSNNRIVLSSVLTLFLFFLSTTVSIAQDVTRTNITFDNGRFTLHGELIIPDTAKSAPVLIFLVGAGENSSYRTLYSEFVKQNIEDLFLNEGIAILYYDKRGVGKSEGRWQRTDLYERAEDAKAAVDFLKTQGRIDSERIGIIGHSQGGQVAQIMGDRYRNDLKFIASLGASTFDMQLQLINQYYSFYLCKGEPDNEAFDKATKQAISDINWVSWFPLTKPWRQLKENSEFDPAPHLLEIDIPAFFAFAENDYYVYPGWAIGALNETFNNDIPENFTLQIIPGADHDFRINPELCIPDPEADKEPPSSDGPFSEYFQQVFKSWVLQHL
ncbi:MAG TPA: hypothetical protein DEQ34_04650 [Balneolaceae bacterium]|nr:hypothetical protein [Balneolaceae bacterium]|tara:strand:+ start:20197 stop:21180 length:984 start_codon:yes stop_codon:yes gene_type:complete